MDMYKPPGLIKKIYFQKLTFGDDPFRCASSPHVGGGARHTCMQQPSSPHVAWLWVGVGVGVRERGNAAAAASSACARTREARA